MKTIPLLRNAWRAAFSAPLRLVIISAAAAMIAATCASATVQVAAELDRVISASEPQDGRIAWLRGPGLTASQACSLFDVPGVMAVALEVPAVNVTAGQTAVTARGKLFSDGYTTARRQELIAGSLKTPGHGRPYCDLGVNVARALFGTAAAAVGQTVDVEGVSHEVRAVIGRDSRNRLAKDTGAGTGPEADAGRVNDVAAIPLDPAWTQPATRLLVVTAPGHDPKSVGKSVLFFLVNQGHSSTTFTLSSMSLRPHDEVLIGRLARTIIIECLLAAAVTILNMLAFCLYWSHDRRGEAAIHAALGCSPVQARLSAACEVLIPAITGWLIGAAATIVGHALPGGSMVTVTTGETFVPPPGLVLSSAIRGAVTGAVAVGTCVAIALGRQAARVSPAELLRAAR